MRTMVKTTSAGVTLAALLLLTACAGTPDAVKPTPSPTPPAVEVEVDWSPMDPGLLAVVNEATPDRDATKLTSQSLFISTRETCKATAAFGRLATTNDDEHDTDVIAQRVLEDFSPTTMHALTPGGDVAIAALRGIRIDPMGTGAASEAIRSFSGYGTYASLTAYCDTQKEADALLTELLELPLFAFTNTPIGADDRLPDHGVHNAYTSPVMIDELPNNWTLTEVTPGAQKFNDGSCDAMIERLDLGEIPPGSDAAITLEFGRLRIGPDAPNATEVVPTVEADGSPGFLELAAYYTADGVSALRYVGSSGLLLHVTIACADPDDLGTIEAATNQVVGALSVEFATR